VSQKLARIQIDNAPPRRRWSPALILLMVALVLSPVLYELGVVCAARWQSLFGPLHYVETPVLDALGAAVLEARLDVESRVRPVFGRLPWKSSTAITLFGAWTALVALLLRSGHRS
jgi:hypothetical protein